MSEENKNEEKIQEVEKTEEKDETIKLKDTILLQKQQLEDQEDRLKRLMAEFDNFKKRSSKEREGLYNSLISDIFTTLLTANGVQEIEAIGMPFDPEVHEAVGMVTDETLGEKIIKEEYRKGYKIGNKVIRHSMVVVAN